jgi:predicted phosphodiesterase
MRWGVIADIHANLPALEAALSALEKERLDGYLCPGDLVGYGPFPNETVALIRSLDPVCVAGNHDLMALGRLSTARADELARETLAWTRERIDDATRDYLDRLPATARRGPVVIAHGSLTDPSEYVRTAGAAHSQLEALAASHPDAQALVLGHTHTPFAVGERSGVLREDGSQSVRPAPGERWLLNPGSVGQPRERRQLVRFAVLDLERGEASLRGVPYDDRRARRAMAAEGLPSRALHRRPRMRSQVKRALKAASGRR